MLPNFKSFIIDKGLFEPSSRILLAVSGGLDSVVMAELFHQAGYRFGIAHCNFQLRGEESDEDERFVESVATRYEVPFYSTRFCTKDFADLQSISIQMAARELRYTWFEEIRNQEGFDSIATAHHQDDQIETLFINLLRGTGISGLHGIPVRNEKVIRPLLFASRDEILRFSREHDLSFREDSSNRTIKYTRNKIRHELIPVLRSIDPDFAKQITATISRIRGTESILKPLIEKSREKVFRQEEERWIITISELRKLKPLHAWLYELLAPFEFNEATISDMIRSLDQESGKEFYSSSHRIIKDRDHLILTAYAHQDQPVSAEEYFIDKMSEEIEEPVHLTFQSLIPETDYQISADPNIATLDKNRLTFPLILRKWKPGDFFFPFGMNKRKKLSDFFIDEKISIPDKEACWLLCSGNFIVWVIGHRIDHRFQVTNRTKELLVVDFLPRYK